MAAVRETIIQEDWSDGMSRDVAPTLISPAGAFDIVNGLLDEDGNPYRRGGTAYKSVVSPGLAPILDNFNRANENPVSQGGKWVGSVGGEGNLEVSGEQLAGENGSAAYNQTVFNGAVYATVAKLGAAPTVNLYIRTAGEGKWETLRGYYIEVFSTGGKWWWALIRKDSPSSAASPLAPYSHQALANWDAIALQAVGAEISVWHKPAAGSWTRLLTAQDSTYVGGRLGAGIKSSPEVRLDDFGGGALKGFSESGLTWAWDGFLLPGQRTVFASAADFGVLGADDESLLNLGGAGLAAPKSAAALEDLLFIGGGTVYGGSRKTANYSTGTVKVTNGSKTVTGAGTAFGANVDAGMLFQTGIGNERVYVVSSVDSDTQLTLRDNYLGTSGEGKAYAARPLYEISEADPYEKVDFLTVCSNRLVYGEGRSIKFTEVNNPHTTQNSLGTVNEHKLPGGVWMTGLSTVGDTVLIFTTAGVWVLDGLALAIVDVNGNPQHRLQQLSGEVVLAGASGLAGSEQRVVVPASDGIYLMDGISAPERISKPIDRLYRKRISDGYPLGRAVVYRGHYFLPILDTAGNVRDMFVCRLDRPTRTRRQPGFPWSRFTGDGGEIAAFAVRASVGAIKPRLLGAQARDPSQLVDCSSYFEPDADHAFDADGTAHVFDLINRDIGTGAETENSVRAAKVRYELVAPPTSVGESRVRVLWSDGSLFAGDAEWDEVEWDAFDWVGEGAAFYSVERDGPPSDGRRPEKFPINKRMRYARVRIMTEGPVAEFALRQLSLDIRPSKAVRR